MKLDIHYKIEMAKKQSASIDRRLFWYTQAMQDLELIGAYLNNQKTNTNGKAEQKTESRKTKCNSISARNKRIRQADTISPIDRASNGI